MSESTDLSLEGIELQSLAEFTEKAYLNYSMYVILDRALPSVADGLKPVQRRIVYAMSELGLSHLSKFKKSARTVGDVLGKYHPHGDSACYEAMVLMAQPFSYRYPLIQGQGNWGSQDDPKSFAAMRYTESKLSAYANTLLSELGQGTSDWTPNFDGTLKEPVLLPAQVPNILLNGSTGIAVGMATDIPPHNLREVIAACIHVLKNPRCEFESLFEFIQGPDYPTVAEIITPKEDLMEMYQKGVGSIRMRGVYEKEGNDIVITALPHQVSGAKIIEQIAAQMQAKKLPMVADIRDESDHENAVRIVIMPRSNRVVVEEVMAHLFATTDLERNYRVNLNMIGLDGRPQVKNLLGIIQEWLTYRTQVVRRRLQYRLDIILDRLHILEGLLIAYLNIDEVIKIIREEEEPKSVLIARFNLTDVQAEAILNLKLRYLARLEEIKIKGEQDELNKEREELEKLLNSDARLKTLIAKELQQISDKYGDDRNSPLVVREQAQAMSAEQMLPAESVTVILSKLDWVRSAKGHDFDLTKLVYKAGDIFKAAAEGKSNFPTVFINDQGRSFTLATHTLPSARGHGEPLTGRFDVVPGSKFVHVLNADPSHYVLLASDAGYGFVAKVSDLHAKNKAGKAMLNLPENSKVLQPVVIPSLENYQLVVILSSGRMLSFSVQDLPQLAKGKGNKIIGIPGSKAKAREEWVAGIACLTPEQNLVLHAGKRFKRFSYQEIEPYQGERGRRGVMLPRGFQNITKLDVE